MPVVDEAVRKPAGTGEAGSRRAVLKAPVSVIVPVKNEAENLRRCLPALDVGRRGVRRRQPEHR